VDIGDGLEEGVELKARYRKIPAYFNPEINELVGRNWFYDVLIRVNIWIDVHIVGIEEFPIEIEDGDEL
jgi:hypothetical protein